MRHDVRSKEMFLYAIGEFAAALYVIAPVIVKRSLDAKISTGHIALLQYNRVACLLSINYLPP